MNRSTTTRAALTLFAFALAGSARAACYSMYDADNRLTYESSVPPIDLSRPVSQQMAARFPSRALIISLTTSCTDDTTSASSRDRYAATSSSEANPDRYGSEPVGGAFGAAGSSRAAPGTDVTVRAYDRADGSHVPGYTRGSGRR